jgi:hypothetical protein
VHGKRKAKGKSTKEKVREEAPNIKQQIPMTKIKRKC